MGLSGPGPTEPRYSGSRANSVQATWVHRGLDPWKHQGLKSWDLGVPRCHCHGSGEKKTHKHKGFFRNGLAECLLWVLSWQMPEVLLAPLTPLGHPRARTNATNTTKCNQTQPNATSTCVCLCVFALVSWSAEVVVDTKAMHGNNKRNNQF